ncbi:hypothetical protein VDG64_00735 [Xanthomonas campestris pv. raphani]|uniref:hypothetical protein n=1 Tax=Xanthomonas campestris TaxID=339 RepID=UPI002B23DB06|nr:hypothetical protein [Xanthomonas campestris]MEA9753710.1 hypothetical protein [Xanthomonas campestris pv. raphani]MEA9955351.1 hypothetical protein [Xanthomonas campestris pv. raphani]MEA9959411.1 hypothetical protein [Xanthomonas campestris pv. raphani]
MSEKNEPPSGTANVLHQMKAYRDLSNEYGADGANILGSRSLERNGVSVPPEALGHWATINTAAEQNRMDLTLEKDVAASKVNALVGAILERQDFSAPNASTVGETEKAQVGPAVEVRVYNERQGVKVHSEKLEDNEDGLEDDEDDLEDDEDEPEDDDQAGPDFGYENQDDNDEAALDDILKISENEGL